MWRAGADCERAEEGAVRVCEVCSGDYRRGSQGLRLAKVVLKGSCGGEGVVVGYDGVGGDKVDVGWSDCRGDVEGKGEVVRDGVRNDVL